MPRLSDFRRRPAFLIVSLGTAAAMASVPHLGGDGPSPVMSLVSGVFVFGMGLLIASPQEAEWASFGVAGVGSE